MSRDQPLVTSWPLAKTGPQKGCVLHGVIFQQGGNRLIGQVSKDGGARNSLHLFHHYA